jgi:hypothetical protein
MGRDLDWTPPGAGRLGLFLNPATASDAAPIRTHW